MTFSSVVIILNLFSDNFPCSFWGIMLGIFGYICNHEYALACRFGTINCVINVILTSNRILRNFEGLTVDYFWHYASKYTQALYNPSI